jgi:hypothetical protein
MKSWKDISLRKALKLMSLNETAYDQLDLIIKQMAILLDKTETQIELMEPKELFEFGDKFKFLGQLPKPKETKVIKVNGREYGLTELTRIKLAQMIDIEEYYNLGLEKSIAQILSVLYLPIKKRIPLTNRYTLEDYEPDNEREEDMLDVDMETMWGTILFFYRGVTEYSNAMKVYLEQKEMEERTRLEALMLEKVVVEGVMATSMPEEKKI